ncbi:MAG: ATP-binding protein [Actinomycetota bacterium]|nr:ATP-binding protein [Actinomycetota bacterium]
MGDDVIISIRSDQDMVVARAEVRRLANSLGFSRTDTTLIATAVSEIARNILVHAKCGEISMMPLRGEDRYGLVVVARDSGPGIRDVSRVVESGFASKGGLGLGLPGARRLMDEFEVKSEPGDGTTVTMTKWRNRDDLERLREHRFRRANGPSP